VTLQPVEVVVEAIGQDAKRSSVFAAPGLQGAGAGVEIDGRQKLVQHRLGQTKAAEEFEVVIPGSEFSLFVPAPQILAALAEVLGREGRSHVLNRIGTIEITEHRD